MIKKLLFSIFTMAAFATNCYAQKMQAAIGAGSNANRVAIYLTSDSNVLAAGAISTLQWNIAVPDSIASFPMPTVAASNITGVSAAAWTISPMITEGGFKHYNITTNIAPIEMAFTAGVEVLAIELDFGSPIPEQIALVTLPDAGANSNMLFYTTGNIFSNGSDLYYSRGATDSVGNEFSYDLVNGNSGTGTSIMYLNRPSLWSSAPLSTSGITLNAINKQNDISLDFTVFNQNEQATSFQIERSSNATDFSKIARVPAVKANGADVDYAFIDTDAKLLSNTTHYYRVKELDANGAVLTSNTVKVDINKFANCSIYPNPVQQILKVEMPEANNTIEITNANGAVVYKQSISGKYAEIQVGAWTAGNYFVRIQNGDNTTIQKIVKVD